MSWLAVGVVGAGAAVSLAGSVMGGQAAGRAARAQQEEAQRQRAIILQQGQQNQQRAMALAESTPQELAILDQAHGAASTNLDREQKLLASIDPSLMEASQQVLKLLRGGDAGLTQAANSQRQVQRQQLVNSLRAQYGPGAESSSIGQKTLQQFDSQTNSLTQQNNQSALGQVFGIATTDAAARSRAAIGSLQNVGAGYSALQERKLNTQLNTGNSIMGALSGTSQSMISSAGAQYVGQQLFGSSLASLGNNVSAAGGMMYGKMGSKPNKPGGGPIITQEDSWDMNNNDQVSGARDPWSVA